MAVAIKPEDITIYNPYDAKFCLLSGHSAGARGATTKDGLHNEFDEATKFIKMVIKELDKIANYEIWHYHRRSKLQFFPMIHHINKQKFDFVFSFHFNAYNNRATGFEVLIWHKSVTGLAMAKKFLSVIPKLLGIPNRGPKPLKYGDRAWMLMGMTNPPANLLELCFIDNPKDFKKFMDKREELAKVVAHKIVEIVKKYK